MRKLIVQFTGICAHFQRVPGLEDLPAPHRVVCVNAADPEPIEQGEVLPHLPYLYVSTPGEQGLPKTFFESPILGGAVLSVQGAEGSVTYDRSYIECMPRLLTYYPDFVPDPDVVLGNRASCYFDVQAGVLGAATMKEGERYAFLTVDVPDGDAFINVGPPYNQTVIVPEGYVVMLRMTTFPRGSHADADFLLEYLTGKTGISPAITDWPGKDGLDNLPCAAVLPDPSEQIILTMDLTTPACSNSSYP